MSGSQVHGLLVTHARLGEAFLDAVQRITGTTEGLMALSNESCSADTLRQQVETWLDAIPATDVAVVFVDLFGGSCSVAALGASRPRSHVHVITGVNLAMLLEFLASRTTRAPEEVVARLEDRGKRAILIRSSDTPAGASS